MKPISGTAPGRTSSRCAQDVRDVVGQLLAAACACGIQPSPTCATRRSAGLPEPPIQIGGCGCCTGRGRWPTSSTASAGRRARATRRSSAAMIASIASSVIAPRSRERHAERVELAFDVAGADADDRAAARERVERRERLGGLQRVLVRGDEHVGHQARARASARRGSASVGDRVEPLRRHHLGGFARDRDVMAHRDVEEPGVVARLRDARPCRRRCRLAAPTASTTRTDSACTGSCIPYASDAVGNDRNRISASSQPGQTTDCSSLYAWRPKTPPSRPTPLILMPPNGASWLRCAVLMPTLPARRRLLDAERAVRCRR